MNNKNDKILAPIKQRIIQIIDNQIDNKKEFFQKHNISSSNFRGPALYSEVSGDFIVKFLTIFPSVNVLWLVLGEGDPENIIYSNGFRAPDLTNGSKDIGWRIRSIRNAHGYNSGDFADRLNIDRSQYSKIENGRISPTLAQCIHICAVFSASMDWLIFGAQHDTEDYLTETTEGPAALEMFGQVSQELIRLRERMDKLEQEQRHKSEQSAKNYPLVAEPESKLKK